MQIQGSPNDKAGLSESVLKKNSLVGKEMHGHMRQEWLCLHEQDESMQRPDTEILEEIFTYSSACCFTSKKIFVCLFVFSHMLRVSPSHVCVNVKKECPKFAFFF